MNEAEAGMRKPVIMVLVFAYLPGFKAGGPIHCVANLVEALGGTFDFRIVTLDRDLGSTESYSGIATDTWIQVGRAKVRYLSPAGASWWRMWSLLRSTPYDLLYLHSFFSRRFSMLPFALWRLGALPGTEAVLAPNGEFSPGALGLRRLRKALYIQVCRWFRWYRSRKLVWHVSSTIEGEHLSMALGPHLRKLVLPPLLAPNTMPRQEPVGPHTWPTKEPGSLSVVFVSRISPMKNLEFAIQVLSKVKGKIRFSIHGPIEDTDYWEQCQRLLQTHFPEGDARHLGQLPHAEVGATLASHDVLLLPTRGENFGYIIAESLAAGCPVVISDQTPWRGLAAEGAGWDLPLDRPDTFQEVLQKVADMDEAALRAHRIRAQALVARHASAEGDRKEYRDFLMEMAATAGQGTRGGKT